MDPFITQTLQLEEIGDTQPWLATETVFTINGTWGEGNDPRRYKVTIDQTTPNFILQLQNANGDPTTIDKQSLHNIQQHAHKSNTNYT